MKFIGAALASACLIAGAAHADTISAYDEQGAKKEVDTAKLNGCTLIFDSAGTPFEVCKMERVEFRPPGSTRSRPGQEDRVIEARVVYKRVGE